MKTEKPALKLFLLTPRDPLEPPFHFHGVPQKIIVAAESEDAARNFATAENGNAAWADAEMAMCEEMRPKTAGVVARDLT